MEEILNQESYTLIIDNVSMETQFNPKQKICINEEDDDDDDEEDIHEYDLERGSIIHDLNITIGSTEIPRYNCAAHKINLVIRKAIKATPYVNDFLDSLSKFAKVIRKSTELNLTDFHN